MNKKFEKTMHYLLVINSLFLTFSLSGLMLFSIVIINAEDLRVSIALLPILICLLWVYSFIKHIITFVSFLKTYQSRKNEIIEYFKNRLRIHQNIETINRQAMHFRRGGLIARRLYSDAIFYLENKKFYKKKR